MRDPARAAPLTVGFSADPDALALALVAVTETCVPAVSVETTGVLAVEEGAAEDVVAAGVGVACDAEGAGWVSEVARDAVAGAEAARDPDDAEARSGGRMLPRPGTGRERWSVRGHVGVMRIGREGDGDS